MMSDSARNVIDLSVGQRVLSDGVEYEIRYLVDTASVVGMNLASGREEVLRISDLSAVGSDGATLRDLEEISQADMEVAKYRMEAIRPLLDGDAGRREVERRASEIGVHFTTLYRWLSRHEAAGTLEALLPRRKGRRNGTTLLSKEVEQIIQEVIEQVYLTRQRTPAQKVVLEVRRRCFDAGIEPPHANTIRARIRRIDPRKKLKRRGEKKSAREMYEPAPGSFPGADYPLAYVQIDHTPVDIMLVDDIHRLPIGRPWISLAMDVYSRMVLGFYLSFESPSETSVAMCVAHAVLSKDRWMMVRGITDVEWPVQGIMETIHVDNAAEFRSSNFRDACAMYGINLEYRPVGRPQFGGHVERLLGTLLKEIHDLPGTTFSSVAGRGEYKSDKHAVMTIGEFEKWLTALICNVYHKRVHAGIGMSPEKKWDIGIFGTMTEPGRGLPWMPGNPVAFMLDFLPRFRRTIQPRGVTIEGVSYYADVLRTWIGATDPDNPGVKRKFVFRRDPRDISVVWFFDPEQREYFRVPFADQSLPSMSIWEYRKAKERLREEGRNTMDERSILEALKALRDQVQESSSRTKKARRQHQARKRHEEDALPAVEARHAEADRGAGDETTAGTESAVDESLFVGTDSYEDIK